MDPSLLVVLLFVCAALLCGCSWGPGTHIYLGSQLLKRMKRRLHRKQIRLLEDHREPFLYGSVAADIINFKNWGGLKNHCHNWNIKERFEALIEEEHEVAFLYGYLCHLAADTVAHNHYVPFQIVYGLPPKVLGHTYWEARADSRVSEEYWHVLDGLRNTRELHENDNIINRAVRRKALSLTSNKFIFNHILLARSKKSWRGIMDQMRSRSPRGEIHQRFLDQCLDACLENMFHVFDDLSLEVLRKQDPTGHAALRASRRLRRVLIDKHGSRADGAEEAKSMAKRVFKLR